MARAPLAWLLLALAGAARADPAAAVFSHQDHLGRGLECANCHALQQGAGAPVVQKARRTPGAEIVPVDSEHCAVHQCLRSG